MASDRDLHVDRIEFYATAVDQLLGAAAKEHVAVVVHAGEIASAKPAVGAECSAVGIRISQIAGEQRATAHVEFADLAARQHAVLAVGDPELGSRCRAAD